MSTRWFIALAFVACAHRSETAPMTSSSEAPPWTRIDVADGSANGYHFVRDAAGRVQFEYDPITPKESSTGFYSGGDPRKETLEASDPRLAELWAMLQQLAADETKHTPERAKGTGAISWDSRSFIIPMGADLNALLVLLKRFGQ